MSVRRVVGGIGRVLVAFGVLLLLFVAYQLWGTGLQEARAQDDLRKEFRAAVREQRERPPTPASAPGAPEFPARFGLTCRALLRTESIPGSRRCHDPGRDRPYPRRW